MNQLHLKLRLSLDDECGLLLDTPPLCDLISLNELIHPGKQVADIMNTYRYHPLDGAA